MWTDWLQTDQAHFYIRGMIDGVVQSFFVWQIVKTLIARRGW